MRVRFPLGAPISDVILPLRLVEVYRLGASRRQTFFPLLTIICKAHPPLGPFSPHGFAPNPKICSVVMAAFYKSLFGQHT